MDTENTRTVIAADAEVTGTIKGTGMVRVDGKFDGELQCEKDATIGKSALVKGNVNAGSVVVEGTVNGNITAKDRIELKASARLTGDIKAKRLVVEEGVMFVGRSEVNPSGASATGTPAAVPEKPRTEAAEHAPPPPPEVSEPSPRGIFKR